MKNKRKTLLIMAAGSGSRYGALKQFDTLGPAKEFLFEYSIYDAIKNGFDHVVIITKNDYVSEIKAYLRLRLPNEIKIDVIAQETSNIPKSASKEIIREKPWGTAHAVWVAKDYIANDFVIINADDYYGNNAFKKASFFIDGNVDKNSFGMVPYQLKETLSEYGTVSRGFCQFENNTLTEIVELLKITYENNVLLDQDTNTILDEMDLVSMNFWICKPLIFDEIETQLIEFLNNDNLINNGEILIPDVIQSMIQKNKIKVIPTDESNSWFGVTYAKDKKNAMRSLSDFSSNNLYPSPLWKHLIT